MLKLGQSVFKIRSTISKIHGSTISYFNSSTYKYISAIKCKLFYVLIIFHIFILLGFRNSYLTLVFLRIFMFCSVIFWHLTELTNVNSKIKYPVVKSS